MTDAAATLGARSVYNIQSTYDPYYWAVETARIRLPRQPQPLSFENHPFMPAIYRDTHPHIVALKGAQLGFSTWAIIRNLWAVTTWPISSIYCVDEATELLSEDGWVTHDHLEEGQQVLTMDASTGRSRWTLLKAVHRFPNYDGEASVLRTSNGSFDAVATPDHRWLVRGEGPLRVRRGFEVPWGDDGSHLRIPKAAEHEGPAASLRDDLVELLGWVVTEGYFLPTFLPTRSTIKPRGVTTVVISQSQKANPEKLARIEALLMGRGVTPGRSYMANGSVNLSFSGELAIQIRALLPSKRLTPELLRALSVPQLRLLVDTMVDGDGWMQAGGRSFTQRRKEDADMFAMAAVLAGHGVSVKYRSEIDMWVVRLLRVKAAWVKRTHETRLYVTGTMWCPETEDGTFLARRNGAVYWTGNTIGGADIGQHTAARINPIIASSDFLTDRLLDIDSVHMKRFGMMGISSLPHYARGRSARVRYLSVHGLSTAYFSGSGSERDAISRDADFLIHDEVDRSDQQVIELYTSRIAGPSPMKWTIKLSTPTFPGYGIDREYRISDMRKWLIKCPGCNAFFEMSFPDSLEPQTWEEHSASHPATMVGEACPRCFYVCPKCKRRLNDRERGNGVWVPEIRDSGIPHGYSVSQMAALYVPAVQILRAKHDAVWASTFWNMTMGVAHDEGNAAFTKEALVGVAGTIDLGRTDPEREMAVSSSRPTFMGIDVGGMLDIIVDTIEPGGRPRTLAMIRTPDWEEVDRLMERFNVGTAVIDALPEQTQVRQLQARWNRGSKPRIWSCIYNSNVISDYRWEEEAARVVAPRERSLSETMEELLTRRVLPRYDPDDPNWEAFIAHHVNSKRVAHYQKGLEREGIVVGYGWVNIGPDHLFHASNYARIARNAPRAGNPPKVGLISLNRSTIQREKEAKAGLPLQRARRRG